MVVAYRSADWDTPWWAGPNRGLGRFNRVSSDPTQYLSLHPLTVIAERLRGLGRGVLADVDTIRWRCWAVELDTAGLVTVDFDSAARFGLAPDELIGDDWAPCQALADRRRAAGDRGLVVPSAALPGTRNVVLFGARVASPYLITPIDPGIDVPTAQVAERSTPPEELIIFVRWHGELHAEIESWRNGNPYVFQDPIPPRIGPGPFS